MTERKKLKDRERMRNKSRDSEMEKNERVKRNTKTHIVCVIGRDPIYDHG